MRLAEQAVIGAFPFDYAGRGTGMIQLIHKYSLYLTANFFLKIRIHKSTLSVAPG